MNKYKHKEFSMGFKVYGRSILEQKFRILSERYKGKGRPRKTDYDFKSIIELQEETNRAMSQKLDTALRGNYE